MLVLLVPGRGAWGDCSGSQGWGEGRSESFAGRAFLVEVFVFHVLAVFHAV